MGKRDRPLSVHEKEIIDRLRLIVADLPEVVVERDGFGHSSFRVGKKSFVIVGRGEGVGLVAIKADHVTQDALIRRGPYYRTPYIGQHGWVSIGTDVPIDWSQLEELVNDAYRLAAPKRLLRKLADT